MIRGAGRFFSQLIQNTPVRPSTLMIAGVSALGIVAAFRLLSISSRNQDEQTEPSSERVDLRNRTQPAVTLPPKIHDIKDLFKLKKNQLNSIRSMRLVVPNTTIEKMREICDILKKLHNLETLEISIPREKYNPKCISLFFQTLSDLAPNLTYLKIDWHLHYFLEDEKVCIHALNQFISRCKNLATFELDTNAELYSSTLEALSTCPVEKLVVYDWYSLFIFLQNPNSLNNLKSLSIKQNPISFLESLGLYKIFNSFCQNVASFINLEEISIENTLFELNPEFNYFFVPDAIHKNENQFCNALSNCKHLKKIELQNFTFDSLHRTYDSHYNTKLIENNHNLYWLKTDISLTLEQKEKLKKRYLRDRDGYTAKKKNYEEIEKNMKNIFASDVFNLILEYWQPLAPPEIPPYLLQEVSSNSSSCSTRSSCASSVEALPSALEGPPLEPPMPAAGRPIISAFEAKREEAKLTLDENSASDKNIAKTKKGKLTRLKKMRSSIP